MKDVMDVHSKYTSKVAVLFISRIFDIIQYQRRYSHEGNLPLCLINKSCCGFGTEHHSSSKVSADSCNFTNVEGPEFRRCHGSMSLFLDFDLFQGDFLQDAPAGVVESLGEKRFRQD